MTLMRSLARPSTLAALALSSLFALAACGPSRAEDRPAPPATAQAPSVARKVDVNTATEAQLMELPKIGPATAKRILEYRKQVGQFKTVDELLNVKGIGEKTLELLRPLVTVTATGTGARS